MRTISVMSGTTYLLMLVMNLSQGALSVGAICSALSNFPVSDPNFRLTGSAFSIHTNVSVIRCAKECLLMSYCCTFNYHLATGKCELNSFCGPDAAAEVRLLSNATGFIWSSAKDWNQKIVGACINHACSMNTRCVPITGGYTCKITHCLTSEITDGMVPGDQSVSLFPIGQSLRHQCPHGYSPCGELICRNNGTWSNISCLAVQSCADIKAMNPVYEDGEYWLQFLSLPGVKMKVYCHNMNTVPKEFITLVTPYVVDTPRLMNDDCTDPIPNDRQDNYVGKFTFFKVGIKLDTMSASKGDRTFYTHDLQGYERSFGNVMDCYTPYPNSCGPIGRGVIDMRGTGWKLTNEVIWQTNGEATEFPPEVTRSYNGQVIEIRCGGFCGDCYLYGKAWLTYEETDVPPQDSAILPACANTTGMT